MSTRNPRDASKERFWRRMVRLWSHSDLTIRAFCQLHDLSEPSFYAWRRILDQREAQAPAPAFVPVQLLDDDPPLLPSTPAAGGLELLLADGRVLKIGPAFDGPTLVRLLAVLQEKPS